MQKGRVDVERNFPGKRFSFSKSKIWGKLENSRKVLNEILMLKKL